jgi:hypothetical protein
VKWLEGHAWWGLFALAVIYIVFGLTDIAGGVEADVGIPLGLTGMTPAELKADGPTVYRIYDFYTRVNGWSLVLGGWLMVAVLWFGFRRDARWAWWVLWFLPIWLAGISVFYLVAGTDPAQPPPPPMISAPFLAALSAAILLVSAPRFFRR